MLHTKAVQKIETHILCYFVFSNFFFFENRAVYEIPWKNDAKRSGPQVAIWRMRIARWVTEATNTHSDYVIITALPLQQWFHPHTFVLRYTYIICVVFVVCCVSSSVR